jgi:hypothetical protein
LKKSGFGFILAHMTEQNTPALDLAVKPRPAAGFGGHFLLEWTATLAVVFLCGATLCPSLRWLALGNPWDLGGAVFSGVCAWICYRWTLSDRPYANVAIRSYLAIGIPVFWALFFPLIMWGLGFRAL